MGMYMGSKAMEGEERVDLRKLSDQIKWQENRMAKQRKKRGKVKFWGKLAKTFFPGIGHAVDFALDRYAQDRYDLVSRKDKAALEGKESFWTAGQAGEFSEAFRKQESEENVSFGESLLSQVADYAGTKVGGELMGKIQGKVQDFGARARGIGGDRFAAKVQEKAFADNPWLENVDPLTGFEDDGWSDFLSQAPQRSSPGNIINSSSAPSRQYDYNPQFEEGGQVPKYYGGGSVQGSNVAPTISEYFNMQGKSLGGSNKQSLAEMLGRK
jgi:hypothetical protein